MKKGYCHGHIPMQTVKETNTLRFIASISYEYIYRQFSVDFRCAIDSFGILCHDGLQK